MKLYSLRSALLFENYSVAGKDVVPATSIIPIQRDLNAKHVFMGVRYYKPGGRGRPLLCCQDSNGTYHLIDGHHGWATACLVGSEVQINIINCDDPEKLIAELLASECEGSTGIPPELDLRSHNNDISNLIDVYGNGLNISVDDIMNLPEPQVNRGEGFYKRDMPQCDHLRK